MDNTVKSINVTKASLEKVNTEFAYRLEAAEREDLERRKILSGLLDSYETIRERYSDRDERKLVVQSWLGIAFLIGELKADANYSLLLEGKENLLRENAELRERIYRLEHPKPKMPNDFPNGIIPDFTRRDIIER